MAGEPPGRLGGHAQRMEAESAAEVPNKVELLAPDGGNPAQTTPTATAAVLELEFPWSEKFDDSSQEWRRLFSELLGAVLACLLLWAVFGKVGMLGATLPGQGITDLQAMITELLLTVGLVSVILGTAPLAQNVGALSAIAVGATSCWPGCGRAR